MKPIVIDFSKGFNAKELDKLLENLPMLEAIDKILFPKKKYREMEVTRRKDE